MNLEQERGISVTSSVFRDAAPSRARENDPWTGAADHLGPVALRRPSLANQAESLREENECQ